MSSFSAKKPGEHLALKNSREQLEENKITGTQLEALRREVNEDDAVSINSLVLRGLADHSDFTAGDRKIFNSLGISYADPRSTGRIYNGCFKSRLFDGYENGQTYFNDRVSEYRQNTDSASLELTVQLGEISVYGAKRRGKASRSGVPAKSFFSADIRKVVVDEGLTGEDAARNKKLADDYETLCKEVKGFFTSIIPDEDNNVLAKYLKLFSPHISLGYVRDLDEAWQAANMLNESGLINGRTLRLQPVIGRLLHYPN